MAAIDTSVAAGVTQSIGWIAPSQVGQISKLPVDRTSVGEGWVVGLQIQGVSKAVHFDTQVNAAAFITAVKNGMV